LRGGVAVDRLLDRALCPAAIVAPCCTNAMVRVSAARTCDDHIPRQRAEHCDDLREICECARSWSEA
jgi:hypothetical protein